MSAKWNLRVLSALALGGALTLAGGRAASAVPASYIPCLDTISVVAPKLLDYSRQSVATYIEMSANERGLSVRQFCNAVLNGDIKLHVADSGDYWTLDDMRADIEDAGVPCFDYQIAYIEDFDMEQGRCALDPYGTEAVYFSIVDQPTHDSFAKTIEVAEDLDGIYLILGHNWLVITENVDYAFAMHDAMRGLLAS